MGIYAEVHIDDVRIIALSRDGGHSVGRYAGLNVADYVGDDQESVRHNLTEVAQYCHASELAVMSAEHGSNVAVVTHGGQCPPADILVTTSRGVALLALAADCVPVAFVDARVGVLAVMHAGWRGLQSKVLEQVMATLRDHGATIHDVCAVIGPSICGRCYEVSEELASEISAKFPVARVDERHLDLGLAVEHWLQSQGVQVQRMVGCTLEDEGLFSYRRAQGAPTGRGGLVAVLPGEVSA